MISDKELEELGDKPMSSAQIEKLMVPDPPKRGCRRCYGRGHVGFNVETGRYAICQKCYPGALESKLPPLELIEKLRKAAEDPEMTETIMGYVAEREMMETLG